MAPRTRRAFFIVTLFLASCAVLGTFINQKVAAQSATDESTLRDSLHSFTDVYALVEQNYAEHLDSDKVDKAIYDGAIPGCCIRWTLTLTFTIPRPSRRCGKTSTANTTASA